MRSLGHRLGNSAVPGHGDPPRPRPFCFSPDLPGILALAATVGLHLWRRNAVLSIPGGTAVHVALATALAAH
jgi:hypothetical protein